MLEHSGSDGLAVGEVPGDPVLVPFLGLLPCRGGRPLDHTLVVVLVLAVAHVPGKLPAETLQHDEVGEGLVSTEQHGPLACPDVLLAASWHGEVRSFFRVLLALALPGSLQGHVQVPLDSHDAPVIGVATVHVVRVGKLGRPLAAQGLYHLPHGWRVSGWVVLIAVEAFLVYVV